MPNDDEVEPEELDFYAKVLKATNGMKASASSSPLLGASGTMGRSSNSSSPGGQSGGPKFFTKRPVSPVSPYLGTPKGNSPSFRCSRSPASRSPKEGGRGVSPIGQPRGGGGGGGGGGGLSVANIDGIVAQIDDMSLSCEDQESSIIVRFGGGGTKTRSSAQRSPLWSRSQGPRLPLRDSSCQTSPMITDHPDAQVDMGMGMGIGSGDAGILGMGITAAAHQFNVRRPRTPTAAAAAGHTPFKNTQILQTLQQAVGRRSPSFTQHAAPGVGSAGPVHARASPAGFGLADELDFKEKNRANAALLVLQHQQHRQQGAGSPGIIGQQQQSQQQSQSQSPPSQQVVHHIHHVFHHNIHGGGGGVFPLQHSPAQRRSASGCLGGGDETHGEPRKAHGPVLTVSKPRSASETKGNRERALERLFTEREKMAGAEQRDECFELNDVNSDEYWEGDTGFLDPEPLVRASPTLGRGLGFDHCMQTHTQFVSPKKLEKTPPLNLKKVKASYSPNSPRTEESSDAGLSSPDRTPRLDSGNEGVAMTKCDDKHRFGGGVHAQQERAFQPKGKAFTRVDSGGSIGRYPATLSASNSNSTISSTQSDADSEHDSASLTPRSDIDSSRSISSLDCSATQGPGHHQ
jgi:hypothetical protein